MLISSFFYYTHLLINKIKKFAYTLKYLYIIISIDLTNEAYIFTQIEDWYRRTEACADFWYRGMCTSGIETSGIEATSWRYWASNQN